MAGHAVVPDASGRVTLTHVETGEVCTRWPVDAREMLATGAWRTADAPVALLASVSSDPSVGTAPGASIVNVGLVVPPLPDDLAQRTKAEIALYGSVELGLVLDAGSVNKEQLLQSVREAHAAQVAASGQTVAIAPSDADTPGSPGAET
jgi:hypothetical protein